MSLQTCRAEQYHAKYAAAPRQVHCHAVPGMSLAGPHVSAAFHNPRGTVLKGLRHVALRPNKGYPIELALHSNAYWNRQIPRYP